MKVIVYGKQDCSNCVRAKTQLEQNQIDYDFVDILADGFDLLNLKTNIAPGASTVPVITIDDVWIGGADQLNADITMFKLRNDVMAVANQGIAAFNYTKVNGEERTLRGTRDFNLINTLSPPKEGDELIAKSTKKVNLDVVPMFDVDIKEWRSVPLRRIISFSKL